MAKFAAPDPLPDTAGPVLTLSTGPAQIVGCVLEIHQPTVDDVAQLYAHGFTLIAIGAYFALPALDAPDEAGGIS